MASKEIAAILDNLMGRNRNSTLGTEVLEPTWEDKGICPFYLVQYCPYDLFRYTRADLGDCPNIHDDDLKSAFMEAPASLKKNKCRRDFLRFAQRMLTDVENNITRLKEQQLMDQKSKLAADVILFQQQEFEMKNEILMKKIYDLMDNAEEAGNKGDFEELLASRQLDMRVGDRVLYCAPGERHVPAVVRFVGQVPELRARGHLVGLEVLRYDWRSGDTDGTVGKKRYFRADPSKGVFCDVSMVRRLCSCFTFFLTISESLLMNHRSS